VLEHVGSIILRYLPFPNFHKVWDELLLEEIHMYSTDPLATPNGALHQRCAPGSQATILHTVSPTQRWQQWQ
jgi:hypothetical protein